MECSIIASEQCSTMVEKVCKENTYNDDPSGIPLTLLMRTLSS